MLIFVTAKRSTVIRANADNYIVPKAHNLDMIPLSPPSPRLSLFDPQ